jgi:hypothetical protein
MPQVGTIAESYGAGAKQIAPRVAEVLGVAFHVQAWHAAAGSSRGGRPSGSATRTRSERACRSSCMSPGARSPEGT